MVVSNVAYCLQQLIENDLVVTFQSGAQTTLPGREILRKLQTGEWKLEYDDNAGEDPDEITIESIILDRKNAYAGYMTMYLVAPSTVIEDDIHQRLYDLSLDFRINNENVTFWYFYNTKTDSIFHVMRHSDIVEMFNYYYV